MSLDRDRLAKLLGMMGSDHDGEILAAARQAERLRREAGVSWYEVLRATAQDLKSEPPEYTRGDVAVLLGVAEEYAELMTEWERQFVTSLRTWVKRRGTLTEKQFLALQNTVERLEQRAGR